MDSKKVETSVPGFDELIDGGFEEDSINLIAGGSGSGKSIFALQFLLAGLKKGESVLYINFEEKKDDFYKNMLDLGWDLQKAEDTGKFIFLEYSPEKVKMMLDEGGGAVESTVLKNNIKRIAIDSVTSFSLLFDDEQSKRKAILGLFDILRKWKSTVLLTVQYDPTDKDDDSITHVEFEADSLTLLYYITSGGARQRFVEVVKMRGTDHSKEVHVFQIGKGGVKVGPKATVKKS